MLKIKKEIMREILDHVDVTSLSIDARDALAGIKYRECHLNRRFPAEEKTSEYVLSIQENKEVI